ncbi:PhzF family phenazine biosynthesis protein [Tropicimonas sediminicola]|uniref:Trans-2,3-dihydro-3-hydroxyanthranilate isomerase n=1 Tax=Tropicimonas sediminicola TaxID=1031541 RepID=A0A239CVW5_9RHOB|nr:PhzF family phenazine biosynthesis protein [Tropicimonas sediminicola]SNS24059.1 trans-2,3-dihydro-3-hydroxyanthranilate isomerase [Tropicimonas sediminicola]
MTDTLPFHTLDVFTDTPFAGNPLAVVLGADGLETAQMQTIAREFNLSETIFVMAPRDARHAAHVRIFFPTAEIPFAGHPTLGCAALLAELQHGTGDFDAELVLEEEAGLVPVTLQRRAGLTSGRFEAPVLPVPHPGRAPSGLIASALGLPQESIGFDAHLPGAFQGGPAFLFVPLADRSALAAARPIEPHWSELMAAAQVDSAYLYTRGGNEDADAVDFRARMFSPTAGIPEDPATGSASAILAAPLMQAGVPCEGVTRFRLLQGAEMGRPSRIELETTVETGRLTRVRIGGSAVRIGEGRIRPPRASEG